MKAHLERRVRALQELMRESDLEAIIFADRENLIYYFGVTEIECMAAVIPAQGNPAACCLWLDTAYIKEKSGCETVLPYHFPSSNLGATIVKAMHKLNLAEAKRVGFHKYFVEITVFTAIHSAFPNLEYYPAAELTYRVRSVKDQDELARIEKASGFLSQGMAAAVQAVKPGVKEVEVLAEAEYAMRKAGSEGASFRMQVLTPGKQLLAHPYADDTVIENGQAVVVHLGASYQGYVSKMGRTVAVGDVNPETADIYKLLRSVQDKAVSLLRPGACVADIYDEVFELVKQAGYSGMFLDHLGYGMGIRQSEFYPIVGKGMSHVLEKDMVVDLLLPTIYKPGVGGPRVTDAFRVDDNGGVAITDFPRELIRV